MLRTSPSLLWASLAGLWRLGFGAAALGKRFRIYSLVSLAVVVAFNALALSYAPEVNAGQPTPFIGLDERIAFATLRWPFGVGGRTEPRKEPSHPPHEGTPIGSFLLLLASASRSH